jgi:hypothetical protein
MTYDFRQRTASRSAILKLIIKGALDERSVKSLVDAYIDDLLEDQDDGLAEDPDLRHRLLSDALETLGIVERPEAVEKLMQDSYVARYRRGLDYPISRERALEVFAFPQGFPEKMVPQEVVTAVAQALADRDATEANLMREYAWRRQQREA